MSKGNEKTSNYGTGSLQSLSITKLDWKYIRLLAMNRTTGLLSASKSSTSASKGSEWEEKTQSIGRHSHRKTSVASVSPQSIVADKRPLYKMVSREQGDASFAAVSRATKAAPAQSPAADKRPLHKTVSDRQGSASFAVAHMAREKSTSVSSAQKPVGVSMGARPKQCHETRETATQASPALAPSNTREASCVERLRTLPVLPQPLSAKGYRLTDAVPFARAHSLTRKAADGSEASGFVIKFPCNDDRGKALRGLEIQEKLPSLKDGDRYFVPVVEKVVENGELICHVEPEGMPVSKCINVDTWGIKQEMRVLCQTLGAIKMMHAQKIAHMDIKPDNLIVENSDTELAAKLSGFDFAMELSNINKLVFMQSSTYENMCRDVLLGEPYSPVLADLWAFTFTTWMLMALEKAPLHWLSGMLENADRRNRISPLLNKRLSLTIMDSKLLEGGSLPVAIEVPDDCLIDLLRKDRSAKGCKALQLFFWECFNFPADIDKLQFASAAEKYILKEMLWIMFIPFSYSNRLERMTGLITAASRCAETFDIHPEYNEEEVQQIIRDAGYRSSTGFLEMESALCCLPDWLGSRVMPEASAKLGNEQYRQLDDFMARKHHVFQYMEQFATRNDLKDVLIGYLAEGGSLNVLEEKGNDDNQLFLWLSRELRTRRDRPKEFSPIKLIVKKMSE